MVDYQVHPRKNTPFDAVTATTDWNGGTTDAIALPDSTVYVVAYSTVDIHLVASDSASDPDSVGAVYAKEQTHIIECPDKPHLHQKGLAGGTLYVTAFHN